MDVALLVIFLGLKVIHAGAAMSDTFTDTFNTMEGTTNHSTVSSTHDTVFSTSQYSTSITLPSIAPSYYITSSPSSTQLSSPTQFISVSSSSPHSATQSSSIINTSTSSSASPSSPSESPSSPSESSSTYNSESTMSPIIPTRSSKPHPASSVSPQKVIVKCGEECKSLKKRLWAAGVFAVFFGVTSLIFMFLLFRQCRISRDMNDPALSRLI